MKKIVLCHGQSGLGNSLFQYFSSEEIALKNNAIHYFIFSVRTGFYKNNTKDAVQFFRHFLSIKLVNYFIYKIIYKILKLTSFLFPKFVELRKESKHSYDSEMTRPLKSYITLIHSSHLMDPKYFSNSNSVYKLKKKINELKNDNSTASLHIRFYHDDISLLKFSELHEYYLTSMNKVSKINKSNTFLVITSDYNQAFRYLTKIDNSFDYLSPAMFSSFSAIEDFILLCNSDYIICSNSTFSWWAAYLSNAEEIYFPRTFGGNQKMDHLCSFFE